MSSNTQLLTVMYVFVLLSSKTCVNGSTQWCPTGADFDLTGVSPDFSGFFEKNGLAFPPNTTLAEDDKIFGCLCKIQTCVQLCCPRGYAADENGCVKDKFTPFITVDQDELTELQSRREDGSRILSNRFRYFFIYSAPKFTSADSVARYEDTQILEDGSIHHVNYSVNLELGAYCILRAANSSSYEIHEFATRKASLLASYIDASLGICLIFAVATFIAYTIISELENLRGSILRCYLASYIFCISMLILLANFPSFSPDRPRGNQQALMILNGTGLMYFGYACACWTNVMSFDTWKAFRRFEPIQDVRLKQEEKKRFYRYSIYAWGSSFVLLVFVTCGYLVLKLFADVTTTFGHSVVTGIFIFPIAIIVIPNTYFYGSTALLIRRRKQETAQLVHGVNKHHKENQLWFNLYLRLYVIMGGAALLWLPAWYVGEPAYFLFLFTVEALQGILIFITCVWRDEVKRSLRQLFNRMQNARASFCRRNMMPASRI